MARSARHVISAQDATIQSPITNAVHPVAVLLLQCEREMLKLSDSLGLIEVLQLNILEIYD